MGSCKTIVVTKWSGPVIIAYYGAGMVGDGSDGLSEHIKVLCLPDFPLIGQRLFTRVVQVNVILQRLIIGNLPTCHTIPNPHVYIARLLSQC